MNFFTVTGNVPMNEGMLSVFWAIDCPAGSVSTQAKSLLSLTSVENEVRRNALAASSTDEIIRRHRISSVTASKGWFVRGILFSSPDRDDDVAAGQNLAASAGTDDERRLRLLDNGGPCSTVPAASAARS